MAREQAREYYFQHFGNINFGGEQARCQICGSPMTKDSVGRARPVAAHKRGRGVGGSDALENIVISHWDCHEYFSMTQARKDVLEKSFANCTNGQVVKMPAEMKENLWEYKMTGVNRFSWI